jgi:hypothetical protein
MAGAPISIDVEYLGLAPGVSNGLGVAITTFRPINQPGFGSINVNIKRAALERLRDDIEHVLAESKVLNNEATMADAETERVKVAIEVLRQFGVTDHEYLGTTEEDHG